MRKMLIGCGVVVLTGVVFMGGYYWGKDRASLAWLGMMAMTGALQNKYLLTQLEAREIDEAKAYVNLKLDSNILSLEAFRVNSWSGRQVTRAEKVLAIIGEYRHKHPSASSANDHVDERINKILGDALSRYPNGVPQPNEERKEK